MVLATNLMTLEAVFTKQNFVDKIHKEIQNGLTKTLLNWSELLAFAHKLVQNSSHHIMHREVGKFNNKIFINKS